MDNLYIFTGPPGVGKSTISKKLAQNKIKSALIEGDTIYSQVVGGYSAAWKEGNHLDIFWEICLKNIDIYLKAGYDVIFNYIVTPDKINQIQEAFKNYNIKFVILLADEYTLLKRDKERPADCQMHERCILLLNNFKNLKLKNDYFLDTSNLTVDETIKIIENNNKFKI